MQVSFVVIGLNEARHLAGSIGSCMQQGWNRDEIEIIYVDSGSTDGSPGIAQEAGADRILHLASGDANAARARNLGLAEVSSEFVQFVDGDTSLAPLWVQDAVAALRADSHLAGAEGDLHEANPAANIYHAICALDWPSSPGAVPYVSGNSLYRVAAISQAGGFDPRMHVGEEPELGARLRQGKWHFIHLDRIMAHHDLDMSGFRDWLRRCYKSGLACAMVVRATGGRGHGFWYERLTRTLMQAAILTAPLPVAIALLPFSPAASLLVLALGCGLIGGLALRQARSLLRGGLPMRTRIAFGLHTYLGKIPASAGILAAYIRSLPRSPRSE